RRNGTRSRWRDARRRHRGARPVQDPARSGRRSGRRRRQVRFGMDLSVVIPVLNERENIRSLLPRLDKILTEIGCSHEILVIDGGSRDGTADAATEAGARGLVQRGPGYGGALPEGLAPAPP